MLSWRRFACYPTLVVDYGLTEFQGRILTDSFENLAIRLAKPAEPRLPIGQSQRAYLLKCTIGHQFELDRILFLDSDILVVRGSLFDTVAATPAGCIGASPSAWDRDFSWSYTASSLPILRRITGIPSLDIGFEVPNSGVWYGESPHIETVGREWHRQLTDALESPALSASLRDNRSIGDQEFLSTACKALGVTWHKLPGRLNMQVHDTKMEWEQDPEGTLLGGHIGEEISAVEAIHFGCNTDFTISRAALHISDDCVADAIVEEYLAILEQARKIVATYPYLG